MGFNFWARAAVAQTPFCRLHVFSRPQKTSSPTPFCRRHALSQPPCTMHAYHSSSWAWCRLVHLRLWRCRGRVGRCHRRQWCRSFGRRWCCEARSFISRWRWRSSAMVTSRPTTYSWSSVHAMITFTLRIVIGGWMFTAPTGVRGAYEFRSWERAFSWCSLQMDPRPEVQETGPEGFIQDGQSGHRILPHLGEHTMVHGVFIAGDVGGQRLQGTGSSGPSQRVATVDHVSAPVAVRSAMRRRLFDN